MYFFAIMLSRFYSAYRQWIGKTRLRPYVVSAALVTIGIVFPFYIEILLQEFPKFVRAICFLIFVLFYISWFVITFCAIKGLLGEWHENRSRLLKRTQKSGSLK